MQRVDLTATPFLGSEPRGVFATRAPTRPNAIGLSVVRLRGIEGNRLHVENLDVLDGTPLLDIKPFVPDFDQPDSATTGWLEDVRDQLSVTRSDDRFR